MMIDQNYELLGEFGHAKEGNAYLARERVTGHLVAIRVDRQVPPEQSLSVARALGGAVPAESLFCANCQASIGDWRRFCPTCGADQAGAPVPADQARLLLEAAVRESENRLEILGQMPRAEGGAAVYFGSEPISGRIVALRLRPGTTDERKGVSVDVTSVLRVPSTSDNPTSKSVEDSFTALFVNPQSDPHFQAVRSVGGSLSLRPAEPAGTKVCPVCGKEYDAQTRFCPDDGSVVRTKGVPETLVGEVIADRYHVLSKIGQGGMGQVYLAEHVRIGRRCAIKLLHASLIDDADAINRFSREAANAARINDVNVADIYDFGESKNHGIYLAMEYVDGEPLSRIIAREAPIAPDRAIRIATQVARGLAAAHRGGVVHRDLTPNNVVIGQGPDGEHVKIVDFGIAKALQDPTGGVTKSGIIVGTPQYMSPEQLIGDSVDGRGDIYQLGCIMFEMLTGTRPFEGDGTEQVMRRLSEPPPRSRDRIPSIPPGLDEIVQRAMAQRREDRFQSAQELRAALERELRQLSDASDAVAILGRRPTPSGGIAITSRTLPPAVTMPVAIPSDSANPPHRVFGSDAATSQNVRGVVAATTAETTRNARDVAAGAETSTARTSGLSKRSIAGLFATVIIAVGSIIVLTREKTPTTAATSAAPARQPTVSAAAPTPPAPEPKGKKSPVTDEPKPKPKPPAAEPSRGRSGTVRSGTLKLSGELPPGAEVRINGSVVTVGVSGMSLPPGVYDLSVTAAGFEPVRDSVRIDANVIKLLALTFHRAEAKQAAPQPDAPRPSPTSVFSPATAPAEIEAALKAFVQAVSAGREAEVRTAFPGISDTQLNQLLALRRDGRVTLDIDYRGPRRIDPAGSVCMFTLWLREASRPPVPVPYQATLIHQSAGWRFTQFARRD